MITIIILIITISIDAMSFGFAQGVLNNKIPLFYCLIMTILSTILFSIPLLLSKYIFSFFSENICNFVNGILLITLGFVYLLNLFKPKNKKNIKNNLNKINLKTIIIETFPISLDAIFTALLNGYTLNSLLFCIILYFFLTFFSIYIFNLISLKLSQKIKFNINFLSPLIFIIIGSLKIFGI